MYIEKTDFSLKHNTNRHDEEYAIINEYFFKEIHPFIGKKPTHVIVGASNSEKLDYERFTNDRFLEENPYFKDSQIIFLDVVEPFKNGKHEEIESRQRKMFSINIEDIQYFSDTPFVDSIIFDYSVAKFCNMKFYMELTQKWLKPNGILQYLIEHKSNHPSLYLHLNNQEKIFNVSNHVVFNNKEINPDEIFNNTISSKYKQFYKDYTAEFAEEYEIDRDSKRFYYRTSPNYDSLNMGYIPAILKLIDMDKNTHTYFQFDDVYFNKYLEKYKFQYEIVDDVSLYPLRHPTTGLYNKFIKIKHLQ
jgi:hypothetical protein